MISFAKGPMPSSSAAVRLMSEDDLPQALTRPEPSLHAQLDDLHNEMESLKAEIHLLRHRDETLNFCMARIDEEMRLAARLQQDFLPRTLPQVGNVHFHTLYRPAGYVSGDLYDVCRLDETHVGFWMTDAVGHGMPAALLTMFIKNAFVTKEITGSSYRLLSPGETLARLNDAMVEQNLSQATFATALYGIVDTQTLQVQFARAGHPLPLLMRHGYEIEPLDADGGLLGIFEGEVFDTQSVQLAAGDRLIFYSDGVEVAFGDDDPSNIHRWRGALIDGRAVPLDQMLREFNKQLDAAVGSLRPKDDLTLIALEVR
jgi:serine phosphatase RsbU (regulator of sigma subunit)